MAFKGKFRREPTRQTKVSCECGGQANLRSRKNYPHGRKSNSLTTWFYRCKSCKKTTFAKKIEGGNRR